MQLFVSTGNSKIGMGLTANLSLPAITTCREDAPCKQGCYATRGPIRFESNQKKYRSNYELWCESPELFEKELYAFLDANRFEYFRWHVSGDIPDEIYYRFMIRTANQYQGIRFMAFTKRYEYVLEAREECGIQLPWNLAVKLSCWPGLPVPDRLYYNIGLAFTTHPNEHRAPKDAFNCPGYCPDCRMCWANTKSILIPYH